MKTTFSIAFYCRPSKASKKNGLAPVELSLILNSKRVFINLPRKENPDLFSRKRKPQELQEYLNVQYSTVQNVMLEMQKNGVALTAENIKEYVKTGGYKPYSLEDLFDEFLTHTRKRIGINLTPKSYKKYEYVRTLFFSQADPKTDAKFINSNMIDGFYTYLQGRYNTATTNSYMVRLKTIITYGMNDGRIVNNPFKNIKLKQYKKKIEYLTEDELNRIYNLEIDNKSLSDVRDAFVLQASTGLSYIDLLNLKTDDIQKDKDGNLFITKNRHKTNSLFTTVILPKGVEILKKHNYELHIISCQKYNLFLKDIQKLAKIQTNLTTHIARKTFCCMLLNRGVSINTVARCAGHNDIRVTRLFYATLQEQTVINEVKAVF